jgi:OTT_1508-like deaminase
MFDRMLEAVVSMNQNRILCRMRSSHAKWDCNFAKIKSSKPALLPQLLEKMRKTLSDRHMGIFREDISQLQRFTETLEAMRLEDARSLPGVSLLAQILKIINRLHHSTCLRDIYLSTVRKLAHYVSVSRFLLEQARLKRVLSTMTVQIVRFEPIASEDSVPSPEDLRSLFTIRDSTTSIPQILDRLVPPVRWNQTNNKDTIVRGRIGELMRNKWPVHAEIQLLFYYELNSSAVSPRVIYSTKKPCFLCSLFFSLHGKFHIPPTHGRLYEKWALPAEIANLTGSEAESLGLKLAAFKGALVDCILSSVVSNSTRGSGPAMSSESFYLDLPAQASKLSVRQTLNEVTTIASATLPDHFQCEFVVSDAEERKPAHSDGEIDRLLDKDGTVNFQVSKSTRVTRIATKELEVHFSLDEIQTRPSPPKRATWYWNVSVSAPGKDSAMYSLKRSGAGPGSLVFDANALLPGVESTIMYDDRSEGENSIMFSICSAREILVVQCRRKIES